MAIFQHPLWGYELTYPEDWAHRTVDGIEGFAASEQALRPDYQGEKAGQIQVRAHWNSSRQRILPLWNQHIGLLAGMLGAKKVGSAPWGMAGASGIEAEIALPKQESQRLWAGILERGWLVLAFSVTHPIQERKFFEPAATQVISSLKFLNKVGDVTTTNWGLPLPPGYTQTNPVDLITDIDDPSSWQAFDGQSGVDALQAFYLRELENYGWYVVEYLRFPDPSDTGFARIQIQRQNQGAVLGLLPYGGTTVTASSPARLVVKFLN